MSISLSLPWPPGVNRLYATVHGRRVLSARGRAYHQAVAQQWMVAKPPGWAPLRGPLSVVIHWHPPTRRDYDIDGKVKCLLDALGGAHAGVYQDDTQITELHIYKDAPTPGGFAAVTITTIDPGGHGHVCKT